jgi:phthiocerol/phenolphthiocerol synthesis type-I polyketide synthase D
MSPREIDHRDVIADWLVARVMADAGLTHDEVELDEPTATFGLSSVQMLEIAGDLEHWLGLTLPPTLMWDCPTIEALAEHLSGELDRHVEIEVA